MAQLHPEPIAHRSDPTNQSETTRMRIQSLAETPEPSLTCGAADEAATAALAARIAPLARSGDVILLEGDLGTGKTTFARAFIRARGFTRAEVPSPTFTLVEVYASGSTPPIYHFDLFRLEAPEDAYELGIEEAFADGISLIEWPDRLGALLPPVHLAIRLSFGAEPASRQIEIFAGGDWQARLGSCGLV
jgi:tRNA threonylcarbamoyladenosine biosynthesis protein TsaE